MSERHPLGKLRFRRLAELSSVVLAVLMVSTGVAHADDNGFPLPDGLKVAPGVTIAHTSETANVLPSLASNEARNVYVSGIVNADVTRDIPPGCPPVFPYNYECPFNGPTNSSSGPGIYGNFATGTNLSSTHFSSQVNTGYIIGCQVSIASDAIGLSVGAAASLTALGGSFGVSVNIGPGEVKFVQINLKDIVSPGRYTIEYDGYDLNIQGCGGRAQARSYTTVEIIGNDYAKYNLYGEPFDIP